MKPTKRISAREAMLMEKLAIARGMLSDLRQFASPQLQEFIDRALLESKPALKRRRK